MSNIYYEKQDNWTEKEYCYLHRVLHRMFYYYNKYSDEISSLDVEKMSRETKVLIYCIITYYHYDFLFAQYKNISSLASTKPLDYKLILDNSTITDDDIYKKMNVIY